MLPKKIRKVSFKGGKSSILGEAARFAIDVATPFSVPELPSFSKHEPPVGKSGAGPETGAGKPSAGKPSAGPEIGAGKPGTGPESGAGKPGVGAAGKPVSGQTTGKPTGSGADMGSSSSGFSSGSSGTGFYKFVVDIINWIWNFIKIILGGINRHLGKVVAFFVFLFLLFYIFGEGIPGIKKTINKQKNSMRGYLYNGKDSKIPWYKSLLADLLGIKAPLGTKSYGGVFRDVEPKGRCNNVSWLSSKDGTGEICVNAGFKLPEEARFRIDPLRLPEYNNMPFEVKQKIRDDTGKATLIVPYTFNDNPTSYVLDFNKAKYADGTPAADLFNNNFDYSTWSTVPQKVQTFTSANRPIPSDKAYKGLDTSIPINKLTIKPPPPPPPPKKKPAAKKKKK